MGRGVPRQASEFRGIFQRFGFSKDRVHAQPGPGRDFPCAARQLFRILCEEMGAEYENLLFYSGSRWLSRGKVLRRILILRNEVCTFLQQKKSDLADYWRDNNRVLKVAYTRET